MPNPTLVNATSPDHLRPRWSKVLFDLWDSKLRTILVVASIAAGVFAIGVLTSAYMILSREIDKSFAAVNPANIEIWTDPFDENLIHAIEDVPGVRQVEGRQVAGVRTSLDGADWQSQTLIGVDDFDNMQINQLDALEGAQFPGRNQLLVSKDFMNDTGYRLGDQVYVKLPDGEIQLMPLVGLVTDQTNTGNVSGGNSAFVTLDTLEHLEQGDLFNRLFITIQGDGNDEAAIAALSQVIKDKIEDDRRGVYRMEITQSGVHPLRNMALAIFGVMGALGVLITVLSSSLIINTLNALLIQHMRQIGVMKLVGGSSRQIMGMYLSLIFLYGVLALLIAVPSAALVGFAFAKQMAYMMNVNLQDFRIVPLAIVLQVLIAFLIPMGAGYFPVHKGAKINVRQAITNTSAGAQPTRLGWLDQLARLLPWVSRPIWLSIRNTFRQRGRLLLTIFTLTIAGAVFIAVFNARASMEDFMDELTHHFQGDVTINFSQTYPITRVESALAPLPEIEGVEAWGSAAGEIWDENGKALNNINLLAPPQDSVLVEREVVDGRWLLPGEEKALVVADTIYNDYPGLKPGDKVMIKLPGERVDAWTVVGVFRFIDMIGDPMAYADQDYLAGLQGSDARSSTFKLVTSEHGQAYQDNMVQFLEKYLDGRGFSVGSVSAGASLQESASKAITVIVLFLLILAFLTAFVGSIGLTGTMGMNVLERTREIGVMRAIGAVDFEVMKSVVIEGLMIGLITWVLAIGLSLPISRFLLTIVTEAVMDSAMKLTFAPQGIFIWLGVVVALSFFASILPARNAARLTINEVLAYE